jgi:tRNA-uridine 2-sulfurtransferase
MAERFREDVVDDFVAEYSAGHTPNPCLRCAVLAAMSAGLDSAAAAARAVDAGHEVTGVHLALPGLERHQSPDP